MSGKRGKKKPKRSRAAQRKERKARTKYFAAFELSGPEAVFCRTLSCAIADRFRVRDVCAEVPPHMTVKVATPVLHVAEIARAFDAVQAEVEAAPEIVFRGTGWFDQHVLYLAPEKSPELSGFLTKVDEHMEREGVRLLSRDLMRNPHVTIAAGGLSRHHEDIVEFLDRCWPDPLYETRLDNITLMHKTADHESWDVLQRWDIGA